MISDYSPKLSPLKLKKVYDRVSFFEPEYQTWSTNPEVLEFVTFSNAWNVEHYLTQAFFDLRPPMGFPAEENSALPLWITDNRPLGFFTDETNLMAIAVMSYPPEGSPLHRPFPPVGEGVDEWIDSLSGASEVTKWHSSYMAAAFAAGLRRMHDIMVAMVILNVFHLDNRGRPPL